MGTSTLYERGYDRAVRRCRDRGTTLPYLYFAYGSNLNREQMAWRCPSAKAYAKLTLPDWQLEFRGVADIVPCPGASVAGALYTICPSDEYALDQYEGYRRSDPERGLYQKVFRRVRFIDSYSTRTLPKGNLSIMFYVMNRGDVARPSPFYLDTIRQGYEDWRLPTDTLEKAVLRSLPQRDELTGSVFDEEWFGEDVSGGDLLGGDLLGGEWPDV